MTLTPEQQKVVATWVAAGDSLATLQKKLSETFQLSFTYRDVRFLVDDLDLALKDPAPKPGAELKPAAPSAGAPETGKKSFFDKAKEKLGLAPETPEEDGVPAEEPLPEDPLAPAGAGRVTVSVDKVNLIPGALASGSVTFSDGVTGKWIVDNYGRPGFTEISRPGYRPNPADAQAFMQELSLALQPGGGH